MTEPLPEQDDAIRSAFGARTHDCSVPRGGGWRPGARWAKVESDSVTVPRDRNGRRARESGRSSEAVDHPFKQRLGDKGAARKVLQRTERHTVQIASTGKRDILSPRVEVQPLVLTHRIGNRIEISAMCEHARALGIRRGMALTQARAQTPGLTVLAADHEGDLADLKRLADTLARRFAPTVAIDGADGLLIDITGTEHLHGGERAMAAKLVRQLARRGYAARVAIAATPGAAHALARHGERTIVVSDDDAAALAPLPVCALRINPAQTELFRRLGLDRIDQLAAVARGPLARRLGDAVITRIDQAFGRRSEPLVPLVPAEPVACSQRFAEPIATPEAIGHWLGVLVPRLVRELAAAGLGARRIEVIAERVDAVAQHIRVGLARPSRDAAHLLRLIASRIGDMEPGYGIDAITLHLRAADPLEPEVLGPRLVGEAAADLAPLVDTLTTRGNRLWRAAPVESDVPERSTVEATPLDPPTGAAAPLRPDDVRRLDTRKPVHPWHPRWPRPVRLLARPEPLNHIVAEMPDKPPLRFTWRGGRHRVVNADGPERIVGEWWRRPGERVAVRDYFRVEDEAGTRFWLYRRGDGERAETGDLSWFLHGWFG